MDNQDNSGYIYIYFYDPINHNMDEIEEELESDLGDLGYVSGSGSGESGGNIDVEIKDFSTTNEAVFIVRKALLKLDAPSSTILDVNGVRTPI